ncbi:hypothetical protein LguiA_023193 [Lonicera macranthoides]
MPSSLLIQSIKARPDRVESFLDLSKTMSSKKLHTFPITLIITPKYPQDGDHKSDTLRNEIILASLCCQKTITDHFPPPLERTQQWEAIIDDD